MVIHPRTRWPPQNLKLPERAISKQENLPSQIAFGPLGQKRAQRVNLWQGSSTKDSPCVWLCWWDGERRFRVRPERRPPERVVVAAVVTCEDFVGASGSCASSRANATRTHTTGWPSQVDRSSRGVLRSGVASCLRRRPNSGATCSLAPLVSWRARRVAPLAYSFLARANFMLYSFMAALIFAHWQFFPRSV